MSNELEPSPSALARQVQVMKVLALLADKPGMSQNEACKQVGMATRTFQRWSRKPEISALLKVLAQQAISASMASAVMALPAAVDDMVKTATGQRGKAADALHAYDRLFALTQRVAGIQMEENSSAGDDANGKLTVTFQPGFLSGPTTVQIKTENGQIVNGSASPPAETAASPEPG